jgi:4-amino-4-deoxy-L-arabinose transferase-like glycosyltransferase
LHQRLGSSRVGLLLVIAAFCFPLFLGLGAADFETDEAAYSFSVARMLEIGDWLAPRSSPSEDIIFLEKPPLKLWIVAAPIWAGILPQNEFGLRFWDAVFGGAAFLYVFGVGNLMAGPLCGLVAVLLLFAHAPLLFDHGLRTNNMESVLVLSYCGGVWHFLRWSRAEPSAKGGVHAALTGVFFVLGFMTKFVAVFFLPLVLGLGALLVAPVRVKLVRSWRLWAAVLALVLGLIAPWFVYSYLRFGRVLWDTMFGLHIYERFTSSLDPTHLHPWSFYLITAYERFEETHSGWLVLVGIVVLLVLGIRRRSIEAVVVLLWALVPIALISSGTSKLYHYIFPFLPPLTLAAGYAVALGALLGKAPLQRLLEWVENHVVIWLPSLSRLRASKRFRQIVTFIVWVAAALAVTGGSNIPVRISVFDWVLFKSSGVFRPFVVLTLGAILLGPRARMARVMVAVTVLGVVPIEGYLANFARLGRELHPIRTVRDCIEDVQAGAGARLRQGLYVDTDKPIWHPTNYYLRRIQPWTRQEAPSPAGLDQRLHDREALQPSLVAQTRYTAYLSGAEASRFEGILAPQMTILEHVLLLPGPYRVCSPEAALDRWR